MTTYSTNFGSYTVGAQPSDWTARWVTTNITWLTTTVAGTESGKALRKVSTVNANRLLSWDAVAAHADTEVLARYKVSVTSTNHMYLHVRGSGAAAAETSYFVMISTNGFLTLGKNVAGAQNTLGAGYTFSNLPAGTWFLVRFRVNGTTLQARIWLDGTPEPSDWQTTVTDSAVTAAGWVGVGAYNSSGDIDFDFVSVGTAGDTAPLSSSTTTVERISQTVVEVANSGTPSAVLTQVVVEVANSGTPSAVLSQLVIEVAIASVAATVQQPIVTIVC
jgi:hypothetical protein